MDGGKVGLIDTNTFEVIWEKKYSGFSRLEGINEQENIVLFSDHHPDYGHCYDDCRLPKYWKLDIKTGKKIAEISRDNLNIHNCDQIKENICLVNFWTNRGDGGYNGFDLYNLDDNSTISSNHVISDRGYLYKDLIIYRNSVYNEEKQEWNYSMKAEKIVSE